MSVPTWKRKHSKTQFINDLINLNIAIGRFVNNKAPKKYKTNYGDMLVKMSISALMLAQIGNSIYMSKNTPVADYQKRKDCFLLARGLVDSITTTSYIYFEICMNCDGVTVESARKKQACIALYCNEIRKSLTNLIKYDKKVFNRK